MNFSNQEAGEGSPDKPPTAAVLMGATITRTRRSQFYKTDNFRYALEDGSRRNAGADHRQRFYLPEHLAREGHYEAGLA